MTAIYALIPAAGRSARFSTNGESKLLQPLADRPLIRWSVDAFDSHPDVDGILIVGPPQGSEALRGALSDVRKLMGFVPGGETRQQSVLHGLFALGAEPGDLVLVHDGARPLVGKPIIDRCIRQARAGGSAVAAIPIADTLKLANTDGTIERTVPRGGLWATQTPQAFPIRALIQAHIAARDTGFETTDESALMEEFGADPVHLVLGSPDNFKVTRYEDLALAEAVLRSRIEPRTEQMRIGFGYDIHRLVPGRRLMLGGVLLSHPDGLGLDGHSDADVLLHAICDSLLGAAALPDIGHLFPNTDPAFRDADSLQLLRTVGRHLREAGYVPVNIDATVIAEAPKIAPVIESMRAHIAAALEISPDRVGIKATTNEGLGSLGAGEGIAAHAVAAVTPATVAKGELT